MNCTNVPKHTANASGREVIAEGAGVMATHFLSAA